MASTGMMTELPIQNRLCDRLRATARAAGALVVATGALVLVGWWARVELLKGLVPGAAAMNPVTAVCFVMCGVSLMSQLGKNRGAISSIGRWWALPVMMVGGLKLASHVLGWEFAVDQWLFAARTQEGGGRMNEMAPNTAAGLVFLAAALWFLGRERPEAVRLSEIFAMLVGLIALLAVVGYAYRVRWLYGLPAKMPMALNTALTFLVMAAGILAARPDRGLMEVVTGDSSGGLLVRRMFPAMVLAFVVAGGLILSGERRSGDLEEAAALHTVASIGIFGGFLLWCARSFHHADRTRRRLEEERERFFRLSLDLLCIAGTDGYFKRVNPAFCDVLGYSAGELLDRPFLELVHPEDVAATEAEMERLGAGQPTLHFENRYRCKDGSWRWLAWKTQPFDEEGVLYAAARDVTEQKEHALAILRLNAELMRQAARLEGVNQELESFSYSVSHDLRAPLRGISGFAQALEEHTADTLDPKGRGYLERVQQAAGRMGQLIDDLLKLSRLTRAEMKMEAVDLGRIAQELVTGYRAAEPERKVEILIAPDLWVRGDAALLRILMDNLIGNAWKFTSKHPAGRIEIGSTPEDGGKRFCHVRDNGVGFDKRYVHKLFGAFQRLHSQGEFPGTGIGLATAHRIIRRHGGRIRAEGEINHGATFGFTLEAAFEDP